MSQYVPELCGTLNLRPPQSAAGHGRLGIQHNFIHLLLLSRIVKLIESVDKQIDLADGKMIDALWHQKFGNQPAVKRLVIEAVNGYRKLANFDVSAKERYMARKFPEVWPNVIASVGDWVSPT